MEKQKGEKEFDVRMPTPNLVYSSSVFDKNGMMSKPREKQFESASSSPSAFGGVAIGRNSSNNLANNANRKEKLLETRSTQRALGSIEGRLFVRLVRETDDENFQSIIAREIARLLAEEQVNHKTLRALEHKIFSMRSAYLNSKQGQENQRKLISITGQRPGTSGIMNNSSLNNSNNSNNNGLSTSSTSSSRPSSAQSNRPNTAPASVSYITAAGITVISNGINANLNNNNNNLNNNSNNNNSSNTMRPNGWENATRTIVKARVINNNNNNNNGSDSVPIDVFHRRPSSVMRENRDGIQTFDVTSCGAQFLGESSSMYDHDSIMNENQIAFYNNNNNNNNNSNVNILLTSDKNDGNNVVDYTGNDVNDNSSGNLNDAHMNINNNGNNEQQMMNSSLPSSIGNSDNIQDRENLNLNNSLNNHIGNIGNLNDNLIDEWALVYQLYNAEYDEQRNEELLQSKANRESYAKELVEAQRRLKEKNDKLKAAEMEDFERTKAIWREQDSLEQKRLSELELKRKQEIDEFYRHSQHQRDAKDRQMKFAIEDDRKSLERIQADLKILKIYEIARRKQEVEEARESMKKYDEKKQKKKVLDGIVASEEKKAFENYLHFMDQRALETTQAMEDARKQRELRAHMDREKITKTLEEFALEDEAIANSWKEENERRHYEHFLQTQLKTQKDKEDMIANIKLFEILKEEKKRQVKEEKEKESMFHQTLKNKIDEDQRAMEEALRRKQAQISHDLLQQMEMGKNRVKLDNAAMTETEKKINRRIIEKLGTTVNSSSSSSSFSISSIQNPRLGKMNTNGSANNGSNYWIGPLPGFNLSLNRNQIGNNPKRITTSR